MIETVQILIEEPEKLRKFLVFVIKLILSSILTSVIYTHVYGNYELLDFNTSEFWNTLYFFFISGKILIVALFYLASKLLLFDILAEIPASILRGAVNLATRDKTPYKDGFLIRFVLEKFGVIKFDTNAKQVSLGKNYEDFHEILSDYQDRASKKEVHSFKSSLMNETLHRFYALGLLYFTVMHSLHSSFITMLVIMSLLVSSFYYYAISVIIEFFDINGAELLFGLRKYKVEKTVTDFLDENSILIIANQSTHRRKRVRHNEKDYQLLLYHGKQRIDSGMVTPLVTDRGNSELSGILLITDKPTSKTAKRQLESNKKIKVVFAQSDEVLKRKLEKYFLEK